MLITLTLTMKGTSHQITLSFNSEASLKQQLQKLTPDHGSEVLTDDYGKAANIFAKDILFVESTDVAQHWKMRNATSIIKLLAERDFNMALEQDPSLKFLMGGVRPEFGSG